MKRWLPEIEQKIQYAFNVIKNENETVQYLLNLGLTTHEIDLVLQHFLSNAEYNMRKQEQQYGQQMQHQARNPLSAQEQQLELIGFSQSVCCRCRCRSAESSSHYTFRLFRILNCNFQYSFYWFGLMFLFSFSFFVFVFFWCLRASHPSVSFSLPPSRFGLRQFQIQFQ